MKFSSKLVPASLAALAAAIAVPAAAQSAAPEAAPAAAAAAEPPFPLTPEGAAQFVTAAEKDLFDYTVEASQVNWVNNTYITEDTEALNAEQDATLTKMMVGNAVKAARYAQAPGLDYDTNRILSRMRTAITSPAPTRAGAAEEVAKIKGGLQGTFDFLDRQRLTDYPRGIRQNRIGINPCQFSELVAGTGSRDQTRGTGARIGIARVGQQVADRALKTLLGQDHRRSAKRIQSEYACNAGAFGAAHYHDILASHTLDTGRSNTQFKTGNRVQSRQRTKTNSHDALLNKFCAPPRKHANSMVKRRDG